MSWNRTTINNFQAIASSVSYLENATTSRNERRARSRSPVKLIRRSRDIPHPNDSSGSAGGGYGDGGSGSRSSIQLRPQNSVDSDCGSRSWGDSNSHNSVSPWFGGDWNGNYPNHPKDETRRKNVINSDAYGNEYVDVMLNKEECEGEYSNKKDIYLEREREVSEECKRVLSRIQLFSPGFREKPATCKQTFEEYCEALELNAVFTYVTSKQNNTHLHKYNIEIYNGSFYWQEAEGIFLKCDELAKEYLCAIVCASLLDQFGWLIKYRKRMSRKNLTDHSKSPTEIGLSQTNIQTHLPAPSIPSSAVSFRPHCFPSISATFYSPSMPFRFDPSLPPPKIVDSRLPPPLVQNPSLPRTKSPALPPPQPSLPQQHVSSILDLPRLMFTPPPPSSSRSFEPHRISFNPPLPPVPYVSHMQPPPPPPPGKITSETESIQVGDRITLKDSRLAMIEIPKKNETVANSKSGSLTPLEKYSEKLLPLHVASVKKIHEATITLTTKPLTTPGSLATTFPVPRPLMTPVSVVKPLPNTENTTLPSVDSKSPLSPSRSSLNKSPLAASLTISVKTVEGSVKLINELKAQSPQSKCETPSNRILPTVISSETKCSTSSKVGLQSGLNVHSQEKVPLQELAVVSSSSVTSDSRLGNKLQVDLSLGFKSTTSTTTPNALREGVQFQAERKDTTTLFDKVTSGCEVAGGQFQSQVQQKPLVAVAPAPVTEYSDKTKCAGTSIVVTKPISLVSAEYADLGDTDSDNEGDDDRDGSGFEKENCDNNDVDFQGFEVPYDITHEQVLRGSPFLVAESPVFNFNVHCRKDWNASSQLEPIAFKSFDRSCNTSEWKAKVSVINTYERLRTSIISRLSKPDVSKCESQPIHSLQQSPVNRLQSQTLGIQSQKEGKMHLDLNVKTPPPFVPLKEQIPKLLEASCQNLTTVNTNRTENQESALNQQNSEFCSEQKRTCSSEENAGHSPSKRPYLGVIENEAEYVLELAKCTSLNINTDRTSPIQNITSSNNENTSLEPCEVNVPNLTEINTLVNNSGSEICSTPVPKSNLNTPLKSFHRPEVNGQSQVTESCYANKTNLRNCNNRLHNDQDYYKFRHPGNNGQWPTPYGRGGSRDMRMRGYNRSNHPRYPHPRTQAPKFFYNDYYND